MSDRNPMLMNNNNPVAGLGIIPGKAMLDDDLVECRKQNAKDPLRAITCYPGGESDINHNIMIADLLFGRRGTRNVEVMDGEPNELVTASVAGMSWAEYASQREMEEDIYFVGVSAGEEKLENPYDLNTVDARNGVGTVRVGTMSVVNNGPEIFFPGDLVMWRLPDCGLTPGVNLNGEALNPINQRARYGAPPTQFKPEIVPFHPEDLSVDLAGIYSAMSLTQGNGGIADIPYKDTLCNVPNARNTKPWSCLQDEAISFKFGLLGVGLVMLQTLVEKDLVRFTDEHNFEAILEQLGLFNDKPTEMNPLVREIMANLFLKEIGAEHADKEAAIGRFQAETRREAYDAAIKSPVDAMDQYARLRIHLLSTLTEGIVMCNNSHRSKIIGRCLSASAPGDTTDILFGHTV
jgi:hypothetical protein